LSSACTATKRNGEPCTLPAVGPDALCWAHDPKNAEKRRRGQSRGGRGKPTTEIRTLKRELEDLAKDVLEGRVERGDGAVVNQILNTRLRAIELERKIKETEELEERIEQLERTQEQQGQRGGKRWGA
jgi:predicted ArsR family transcriptional regulator